jgi:hypothetical protein
MASSPRAQTIGCATGFKAASTRCRRAAKDLTATVGSSNNLKEDGQLALGNAVQMGDKVAHAVCTVIVPLAEGQGRGQGRLLGMASSADPHPSTLLFTTAHRPAASVSTVTTSISTCTA